MSADLEKIARELKLAPERVEKTVQLLDDGNTIPFVTRFRKDETGGLNEKQILAIKQFVQKHRAIEERRSTILKSIESHGKLTDELKTFLGKADTLRQLEDLYLPFKPKKHSEAATARQQGLEALANEILEGKDPSVDLAARATEFVRVDKGLSSVDEVIAGVGHIIAEGFSDNRELRAELRKIVWNTAQLASTEIKVETPEPKSEPAASETESESTRETGEANVTAEPTPAASEDASQPVSDATAALVEPSVETNPVSTTTAEATEEKPAKESETQATSAELPADSSTSGEATPTSEATATTEATTATPVESESEDKAPEETAPAETASTDGAATPATATEEETAKAPPKKKKKKRKKKSAPDPFKDYFEFKQSIKNLPHHRILAINRGERAGKLKVELLANESMVDEKATAILVPENHASAEFIKNCAKSAVDQFVIPSLTREVRRELTEAAERHAVEVFANNLKNLLLQPPISNRRILAIDPGYKRGCTIAAIDEAGNLLESGQIFVVGNQKRREESAERIQQFVEKHNLSVISIGNGAASRETEQMVSSVLTEKMADKNVKYIILNEAGASTYSTSELGREEFPDLSAHERSAVSIGRRLQDPLSELVKISPANIGVGMYQHDVKAKHLSESLDEVVQFCVNRVGVNVNTASPSLLKYVSGLNQLTARRIYEYRQTNGPFKNRQQLNEVTGFGDATFTQAAGFLKIHDGDEPLDGTSIHPESYGVAKNILAKIEACPEKLFRISVVQPVVTTPVAEPVASETSPATPHAVETKPETETPVPTEDKTEAVKPVEATAVQDEATAVPDAPAQETAAATTESISATTETPSTAEPAAEPAPETPAALDTPAASETPAPQVKAPTPRKRDPEREAMLAKLKELRIDELASEFSVGRLLISDIVKTCSQPRRDPRDGISKPVFRSGILKTDDLKIEMQLDAQVVNVVDFGVFVDIGLGESSLIHVSQLSNRFIRNPHQFFAIGDVVKVWVTEIDSGQRRVKLTAIKPGTPKFDKSKPRKPRGGKPAHARPEGARSYAGKRTNRGKPSYSKTPQTPRRPRPPKKAPPITKEMLDGKEPMRSFSDLLQFVEKKPDKSKEKDES